MLGALVSTPCERLLVIVPTDALRTQVANKFLTFGVFKAPGCHVLASDAHYPVVGILEHKLKALEELTDFFLACNVVVTTSHIAGQCEPPFQTRMAELCTHLFVDEAHHAEAPTWKAFKSHFASRRILQFTATPFREDDQMIDGEIIYRYPLRKAQEEEYFKPIRFVSVFEFDTERADQSIAQATIQALEEDETGRHVAMARVASIKRAEDVHRIYQAFGRYSPVLLHSNLNSKERSNSLLKLTSGESRIVVCVDMLGEGFDMPELKIAAFHDIRKSLAVTLQLAGRFTRARKDLGNATFIANVANVEVENELAKLYSQDPDWNALLPELSETAIAGEIDSQEFLRGFGAFPSQIPLREIRPATSMVIYRTRCSAWKPEAYRKGLPGLKPSDQIHHTVNKQERILIVVAGRSQTVPWSDADAIRDWEWELFIAIWDKERELLYIHGSSKKGEYRTLAKALCGDDVTLIQDPILFRCFSGVTRLLLTNLGLNEQFGRQVRYVARMGADVAGNLSQAAKQNARKAVISGVGYESGAVATIGAAKRGRVWSFQRPRLDGFANWCKGVGAKIVDETIDPEEVLEGTLVPEIANCRPAAMPISIDWPESLYAEPESALSFLRADEPATHIWNVSIELVDATEDGPLLFRIFSESWEAHFKLVLPSDDASVADYRFEPVRQSAALRCRNSVYDIVYFFDENPPVFWFADGSCLEGNLLVKLSSEVTAFDRDKIEVWDWTGTNISKEAQGVARESDSIQYRVIDKLKRSGGYDIIFDDDGAGESADVVTATLKEDGKRIVIEVDFYHCKYAKGAPGARVGDLYEVCGQAQKSISWLRAQLRKTDLFVHMLRRETKVRSGQSTLRYEVGNRDKLVQIRDRSRLADFKLRIFIVQPGLSRKNASDSQLALLSVTENYLLATYGVPLGVIGAD